MVIDEVRRNVTQNQLDGVTPVLNVLLDTVRSRYNEWFPTVPAVPPKGLAAMVQIPTRPDLAFIVGDYELDNHPTARLITMASQLDFPPLLYDFGFALQGIAQYALYILNRLYQPDRSVQELTALAVYTITETASQDGKVGGRVFRKSTDRFIMNIGVVDLLAGRHCAERRADRMAICKVDEGFRINQK
ncbi:MAG TPA: hypothetical protein VNE42_05715 [Acidimicrobiales bacterium]|nr:hypothetical protein [Acidimicrobiales bacterium]